MYPRITYRFHLPDGIKEIALEFEPDTFLLRQPQDEVPPAWTMLDFEKCHHCPLSSADSPTCPFASSLARYVEDFGALESFTEVEIEAITPVRRVSATKPLQSGIASMLGLIGATSGCPHLAFYRPMARFHSPFSDEDETVYRVLALFTLRSFLEESGEPQMEGLADQMTAVGDVNAAMAERIRHGFDKDAMVNAIVILDCFSMSVPLAIESKFDTLRRLFNRARG